MYTCRKMFITQSQIPAGSHYSVGGRELSGDSGHTFLSSDGMLVEYIHWSLYRCPEGGRESSLSTVLFCSVVGIPPTPIRLQYLITPTQLYHV